MHEIEPFYGWLDYYNSEEDAYSPFYEVVHSEFQFQNKIYNYYIHPQWDYFGSNTLYLKLLYIDYEKSYAIIELIGEWNDAIYNDIMTLKREIIDLLLEKGINKYVLLCGHVLNFHYSDDSYYEEWREDIEDGWVVLLDVAPHVEVEMQKKGLGRHLFFGSEFNNYTWRKLNPEYLIEAIDAQLSKKLGM